MNGVSAISSVVRSESALICRLLQGFRWRQTLFTVQPKASESYDCISIGNGVRSQYFSIFRFLTDCAS
jgi:hypothetical protein